jgi:hypothetical protein
MSPWSLVEVAVDLRRSTHGRTDPTFNHLLRVAEHEAPQNATAAVGVSRRVSVRNPSPPTARDVTCHASARSTGNTG